MTRFPGLPRQLLWAEGRGYFAWLEALTPLLQPGEAILDLGCGCGIPVAQELAQHFCVTGVDLSAVQIARARQLVPQATFLCADMTTLWFLLTHSQLSCRSLRLFICPCTNIAPVEALFYVGATWRLSDGYRRTSGVDGL